MEKQVIFRDQQEFQAADPNNLQTFVSDTIKHAMHDAVSSAIHYTGLDVTPQSSNTALDIAAGRIYNAGQIYTLDQATTLDLFAELPLTTQKIVAVVAWGQTVETDIQPRDFLIDIAAGTTQPQAVAMQKLNQAVINIVPGVESASPQPPTIQSGTIAVALVTLDPTGITNIAMQAGNKLPNAADHEQRIKAQETWKGQAEPRISSIATDLSALANKTNNLAKLKTVTEIAGDVANLKQKLGLPATYSDFDADQFGDTSKSDTAHLGYSARVANGILFDAAASALAPIDLFNPNDPAMFRDASGLVLPKFTNVAKLKTDGYAGDLSVSQYQTQSVTIRKQVSTEYTYHYGYTYNYYPYWYGNYYWGYYGWNYGYSVSSYGYYTSRQVTNYVPETTTHSVNGALIAQTMLIANAMWLTQIGLQFTAIGATGDVNLLVVETVGGKPDMEKAVAEVVIPVADLKQYPTETTVPIVPTLLEAGKRYALVMITQGAHRVATVDGNNFTQGTLFNGTDGDYFVGDLTKDLMFTLYAAKFDQSRTEVVLQEVSLSGGISDLDIRAKQVLPEGTSLDYEIQVGGKWYRLDDGTNHLLGNPGIVPLRAVFLGTEDLAPALVTGVDLLTASRPNLAGEHWSTVRTLPAPATSLLVELVVDANYDPATDSCVATLEDAGVSHAATLVESLPEIGGATRLRFHYTIAAPGLSTYQVKIVTGRSSGSTPFAVTERTDIAL